MKKFIALILLTGLITGILISCGEAQSGNQDNPAITADPFGGVHPDVPEEPARIEPDLPADLDFGGYTFTFLSHRQDNAGWDWLESDPREIISEEETGEPINDSVFRRNATLQAQYNFELDMLTNTDEVGLLRRTVNAGDDIYDAVIIFNNNVPGAVQNDLLIDVEKFIYIDQSKPWWDPAANDMSIAGRSFLLAGDLLILDNEATNALIFNKDMMRDMGLDLPYAAALEGRWTMDMLYDIVRDAGRDLNGDGQITWQDDQFGLVTFNDTIQAFLVGGGGALATKNDEDIPFIDLASEKNLAIFEKAMNLMYLDTNPSVLNVQSIDSSLWMPVYYGTFEENRALFMWIRMRVVEVFRGMDADFGIMPMPKFDENQENYRSLVNPYTGVMLGIPKTVNELDRTGMILEAISAESRYTLQPAYYEVALQRKFARDEESADMLDIIFSTRVYDIGGVYSFGNIFGDILNIASREDRNIISFFERREAAMQTAIDRLVDRIESMD